MANARATTASSTGTIRSSARSTEPESMPIVGVTSVDKEIDGAHDPTDEQIRECAYQCWVDRGSPEGNPEVDWHTAERKLRSASQRV